MSRRGRVSAFLAAAGVVGAVLIVAYVVIPGFGHYPGPYGPIVDAHVTHRLGATDAVTGVNFGYRAIDTLGEEFILFVCACGVALMLRQLRPEGHRPRPDPDDPSASPLMRSLLVFAVAPLAVLGAVLASHGQVSPGGGFQGGAIAASSTVLLYLAIRHVVLRRLSPTDAGEIVEALGAAGFVLMGLAAVAAGGAFLADILPLGVPGTLASGGSLLVISLSCGVEVIGGLTIIVSEFLEQTLLLRLEGDR